MTDIPQTIVESHVEDRINATLSRLTFDDMNKCLDASMRYVNSATEDGVRRYYAHLQMEGLIVSEGRINYFKELLSPQYLHVVFATCAFCILSTFDDSPDEDAFPSVKEEAEEVMRDFINECGVLDFIDVVPVVISGRDEWHLTVSLQLYPKDKLN